VALLGRSSRTLALTLSIGVVLALTACGDDEPADDDGTTPTAGTSETSAAPGGEITVGGADFTEMLIMQEIYAAALTDAGYTVEIISVENREVYAPSLESGDIDIVPDYAATLTEYYNVLDNGPDAELVANGAIGETLRALRELAEPHNVVVLDAADAANQNAFFVTQAFADENAVATLSDLGALGQPIVLAATVECPERPFCEPGLEETYGLDITEVLPLGYGSLETKQAVITGEAQLGLSGTTDGTLAAEGLVVLEDDASLQLADNLTPVLNADTFAEHPDLEDLLDAVSGALSTEILAELNKRVDVDREQPADVAMSFLVEAGLIDG
jgi:osmoprotectant transport system substrate-binding protein